MGEDGRSDGSGDRRGGGVAASRRMWRKRPSHLRYGTSVAEPRDNLVLITCDTLRAPTTSRESHYALLPRDGAALDEFARGCVLFGALPLAHAHTTPSHLSMLTRRLPDRARRRRQLAAAERGGRVGAVRAVGAARELSQPRTRRASHRRLRERGAAQEGHRVAAGFDDGARAGRRAPPRARQTNAAACVARAREGRPFFL